jgi:hypothetical protein
VFSLVIFGVFLILFILIIGMIEVLKIIAANRKENEMAIETFKATSKLVEGLQVDNFVRDFTVRMDEPKSLGGTDTGMNRWKPC